MAQDTVDRPKPEHEKAVATFGPADAVLFDTLDARLATLDLSTAPDGTLLATTPDTSSVVRLAVTDRGLAATVAQEAEETERRPVEQIDPAPESDVNVDTSVRTRSRGD